MNSVCEEILHLDHQRVNQYKGNYDQFKEMEAQKRRQQVRDDEDSELRFPPALARQTRRACVSVCNGYCFTWTHA